MSIEAQRDNPCEFAGFVASPAPARTPPISAEMLEALVEFSPDGALITDANLDIVAFNRNFLDIWGLDASEVQAGHGLAEALRKVVDPDDFRIAVYTCHADRDSRASGTVRLHDGRVLDWHSTAAYDRAGEYLGRVWYYRDATERARMEEQLRGAESRLRALVEQIPAVTYVQQVDGHDNITIFMSPQVETVFGYTPDELLNGQVDWLETIHPDDREAVLVATRASNMSELPFDMEYRAVTKQGEVRWVHDEATVIRDAHGRAQFWQGIIDDITEERLLEEAVRRGEARFRSAFDEAPTGIALLDLSGVVRHVNDALCTMLGYGEDELLAPDAMELVAHPDDLKSGLADLGKMQLGELDRFQRRLRLVHRDGHTVWVQADVSFVFNGERDPEFIIAQLQDITEQHRLEEELRQSEAVFRSAFDHAAIGMARVAPDGRWLDVNAALCAMLGYMPDELLSTDFQSITHPEDLALDVGAIDDLLEGRTTSYHRDKRYIHKSGATIWGSLSVSLVRSDEGEPLFFISQVQDITERRELERKLEFQANHDDLTGMLNRHGLMRRLEAAGDGLDEQVGILVVDMDGFKAVNDLHGHAAGDQVLREIARRIAGCVRAGDYVARLGGDEFVVALNGPVSAEAVERLSERVRQAACEPIALESGALVSVDASVGTGLGPRHLAVSRLLKAADDAMYDVKRGRRAA